MNCILKSLHGNQGLKQLAKFCSVGVLNFVITFTVFVLSYRQLHLSAVILDSTGDLGTWITRFLNGLGIPGIDAAVANTAGYLAGMTNSFFLNKLWTFEAQAQIVRQMYRFVVVNVFSLVMSTLILLVFVDIRGAPYLLVWCITFGIIFIINFLANKYWTFKEPLHPQSSS
ncbi:MAG: GtrA family protein [Nitrospirae bacterium]|nr:GtrA family protein [Nitrospirota bacterium]MDE3041928.1 GtrA family protein [Nitrospirota bacterium]